jgi:hypothetical protein
LLCLAKAQEGGESKSTLSDTANDPGDVVSAHHLWNTLQAERPDVAELFTSPEWYFDRKGEVSEGQNGWVKKAVRLASVEQVVILIPQLFYYHDGKVISSYDPYFLKSSTCRVPAW